MAIASDIDAPSSGPAHETGVVLGEDWVSPQSASEAAMRRRRSKRGFISINSSPLARKIITFNLLALIVLVAGVLYLNPFRDSLVFQREQGLVSEAVLIADVFETQMRLTDAPRLSVSDAEAIQETLSMLEIRSGVDVLIYSPDEAMVASTVGQDRESTVVVDGLQIDTRSTLITDFLNSIWVGMAQLKSANIETADTGPNLEALAPLIVSARRGITRIDTAVNATGDTVFFVATPVLNDGRLAGFVTLLTNGAEIEDVVRNEREQVLQMFVIAILVSIGLSLVLASTIANPLSDLAAAAEIGRDRSTRTKSLNRIRIPDLSGRPDEIGRLSGALRGMVGALYDRIDANEQFAADVAHEIKNPLASLRSAIGTLRMTQREDHKQRLLEVIEHDVQRLDRLVSDISNASRLDSELVKEEEEPFDLLKTLGNLIEYMGNEAREKGIEFISDLPSDPITIHGLEARLAQVFVNLISNATSFCEDGDAIRVWARRRENRVLIVVEDTGPGIPEEALTKIFNRFYSERPEGQFGNNSGLGLAISKQIVEAHGGVLWAENIRPTDADVGSEPLGARFVVGLPV